jgi:serine/threonine protein kinase
MKGIEGSTLGRYELRRCIARGSMSEVYLGYDRHVRRRVAIKVLYGSDEAFILRIEREARAVGTLSHDHILPLYDFGEQRPWYYLVMPYVEGGTLRDYLFQKERLSLEEAGNLLDQIASALQHAHDHGVIHRDVKPSNILRRPDGHTYLVDFGLAKAKQEVEATSHAGMAVGTPEYMAPEQTNGESDARSDIYSLGIILYQMLTGCVPFIADSPVTTSLKHIQTIPRPPSEINSAIPPLVEEAILKALMKDPAQRYQEAGVFAYAYKKALLQERAQGYMQPSSDKAALTSGSSTGESSAESSEAITTITPSKQDFMPLSKTPSPAITKQRTSSYHPAPRLSGTLPLRQQLYQGLVIVLCLLLLTSSIILGLLWQNHVPTPGKTTQSTPILQIKQTETAIIQTQQESTLAAQARVQATAGITQGLSNGIVLYANDLTTPSGDWLDDGSQCFFSAQGYHVSTYSAHTVAWCYSSEPYFSDAIITAQAQLLRGDAYGLIFRLAPWNKTFYVLELHRDGAYRFIRAQGDDPQNWLTIIDWTSSPVISTGYGRTNTFLIICDGPHFRFYINKQLLVSTVTDTAYASGTLGFLVGGDSQNGTEAVFSNLWVFKK